MALTTTTKQYPKREIDNIQFAISAPDDIVKKSVCEITTHKLNGAGSLYDQRMGPMEHDESCVSCGLPMKDCPGHSGHINLNHVVAHPMFHRYITNVLKCCCVKCHRLVVTADHLNLEGVLKYHRQNRFEKVVSILEKIDYCYHCQSPKPRVSYQQKTSEIMMTYSKKKFVMGDVEIKAILDDLPDDDVALLGFNPTFMHPKNLMLSVLEVLPPRARPYIISDNVACDDDLTIALGEIHKANKLLADDSLTTSKRDKALQTLKFRIKTMFNNSQAKARSASGKALKCIKSRLGGKEGLIRKNLMGKRRDFSGRDVISADPLARTDEVIIPPEIATNLTFPETVNDLNREVLQKILDDGRANYVIKPDGSRINLKYATFKRGTRLCWGDKVVRNGKLIEPFKVDFLRPLKPTPFALQAGDKIQRNGALISEIILPEKKILKLENGDILERWLQNDDITIFNRQPTLHSGSMLGKRIVVRPGRTIRFNLASCKSFNSDFDGDEMNIFPAQSIESKLEIMELSCTRNKIMTSKSSKNVICLHQDSLLGPYLMTRDDQDLGRERFFDICMRGDSLDRTEWSASFILDSLHHIEHIMQEHGATFPLYSGKSLISLMLPRTLNYTRQTDARKDEPVVKIVKGVMLQGAVNKSVLGQAHNSLVHVLYKEYGKDIAINFIDNCQFITYQYLLHRSFSIGLQDCITTISEKTESITYKCFLEAKEAEENIAHPSVRELRVCSILNKARDMSQKLARDQLAQSDNGFVATVSAGSKGEYFNITQIMSMLAQQQHMGKRIQKVLNRGKRALPHYPFTGMTLEQEFESAGFIRNSFLKGLNPQEFVWHAVSGREGISDTALKTASSGYLQRRLSKLMENVTVQYDQTVRMTDGNVIQWNYGRDGMSRTEVSWCGDDVFFCDVSRIADRLNNDFELRDE